MSLTANLGLAAHSRSALDIFVGLVNRKREMAALRRRFSQG